MGGSDGLRAGAASGKPCATYSSDLKVWMPSLRTARYPDLTVVYGNVSDDPDPVATTRPTVLVEVLSPSTKRVDGREKFDEYATLATLRDYVLVSTTARAVTHWHRDDTGRWLGARLGPEDTLTLDSVGVAIAVADVYRDVELDKLPRWRLVQEP